MFAGVDNEQIEAQEVADAAMRHRDSSDHFEYIMPLEQQPIAKFVYKVPKERNPSDDFIATYSFGKTDARTPNDT